jgi:hypothetical protein
MSFVLKQRRRRWRRIRALRLGAISGRLRARSGGTESRWPCNCFGRLPARHLKKGMAIPAAGNGGCDRCEARTAATAQSMREFARSPG